MMSGHLMFFRHEKRVMDEFFNFPKLRSLHAFLDAPDRWVDPGAGKDEAGPCSFRHEGNLLLNSFLRGDRLHSLRYAQRKLDIYP
jgi:hypothetical protein